MRPFLTATGANAPIYPFGTRELDSISSLCCLCGENFSV
jgi:hypothetical protein